MSYGQEKFYGMLRQALMNWVWNNPRLLHKINKRDLIFLFEFDPQHGLSIDLRRFELDYYKATFYLPEEKTKFTDAFVLKVLRSFTKPEKLGTPRPYYYHHRQAYDLRSQPLVNLLYKRQLRCKKTKGPFQKGARIGFTGLIINKFS